MLQRSFDLVEIDVGNETVDAGINTGRLLPMNIAFRRNKIGKYPEVRKPARVGGLGSIAADALEIVALEIELRR